jgi:hypothetical protein
MKEYIQIHVKVPTTRFNTTIENLKKTNESPDEYAGFLQKILNEAAPSDECDINEVVAEIDKAVYSILTTNDLFLTIGIKALGGLVEMSRFGETVMITFKQYKLYDYGIESKEI